MDNQQVTSANAEPVWMVEYYGIDNLPMSYQRVHGKDKLLCNDRVKAMRLYPSDCIGWNVFTIH